MEYRKIRDEGDDRETGIEDVESLCEKSVLLSGAVLDNRLASVGETKTNSHRAKAKSVVTLALTILTSSQAILIVWSKRAGKYEYSVTTANFLVESLKCAISLVALARIWKKEGVTEDNRANLYYISIFKDGNRSGDLLRACGLLKYRSRLRLFENLVYLSNLGLGLRKSE